MQIDEIIQRTVWIVRDGREFVAMDLKGTVVGRNKYGSNLAFILREEIRNGKLDFLAIAPVVPTRLNRSPNKSKDWRR